MKELLAKIKENCPHKKVISLCKKLEKKCSFKSGKDMDSLSDLCLWLYIYGHNELSLDLCSQADNTVFDGSYNVWTFIHHIKGLKARILREMGQAEQSQAILNEINSDWLTPNAIFNTPEKIYEFEMKRRSRFTYEDVIQKINIDRNLEEKDEKSANEWRFCAMKAMTLYTQFNGFTQLEPYKEQIESDIKIYIDILSKTK